MRYAAAVSALLVLLLSRPGFAQEDVSSRLFGSWRLISWQVQIVGEEGGPRDVFGPHPFGRLILTPEHYMAAYISRTDRKPPTNEADAAALLSSMLAYTGKFRLEADKFVTKVDGAWNEIYKGTDQVRYFAIDGDKLNIRTAEQPSAVFPGK